MLFWITPSLAVTDSGYDPIEDPPEALASILAGHEAIVDTLENAYTVLAALGLSDDEIANKIDFALGLSRIDPADIRF
jgi:hypothetical protein